jgi:hypothetical protein
MYSFGRKNLSGLGDISYNPLGGKRYKSLRIGVSAMTFQSNTSWLDSLGDNSLMHPGFTVIKPYAIIELGNAKRRIGFTHFLEATGLINWQGREWKPFYVKEQSDIGIYGLRLNYFGTKRGPVSVFEYKTSFESVSQVSHIITSVTGRVQVEAKYTWNYIAEKKKARSIELRGYWGKVGPLNYWIAGTAKRENMYLMLSGASGQQDVFYDEYFRGRNTAPLLANIHWPGQYGFTTNGKQRMNNMGGMGTATFMGSYTSLTAFNFSMSLPKVPGIIRVFADYARMPSWSSGLPPSQYVDAGLLIRTGFLQVSVPLFMNNDLQRTLGNLETVGSIKQYVLPTYKQQLQRGIRFSLNIPLNSGLFLRKSLLPSI